MSADLLVKYVDDNRVWEYRFQEQFITDIIDGEYGVLCICNYNRMFYFSPDGELLWEAGEENAQLFAAVLFEPERILIWGNDEQGGFCAVYAYDGKRPDKVRNGFRGVCKVVSTGDGYAALWRTGSTFYDNTMDQYDYLLLLDGSLTVKNRIAYTVAGAEAALRDVAYADGRLYLSVSFIGGVGEINAVSASFWNIDDFHLSQKQFAELKKMPKEELGVLLAEQCHAYVLACTPDGLPAQAVSAPGCLAGTVSAETGTLIWNADSVLPMGVFYSEISSHTFEGFAAIDRYAIAADGTVTARERTGYKQIWFV